MQIPVLLDLIQSGSLDKELDDINRAIDNRRRSQIFTLTIGQSVWFNSEARPQYLVGRRCEVLDINRTRIVVRIINQHQGGRFHGRITTSLNIVTAVKPNYAID